MSAIAGGNPTALADPERWATVYVRCAGCKRYLCDRCHAPGAKDQCTCGGKFYRPGPEEAIAIMHGEVPTGPRAEPPAPQSTPPAKDGKPWWKFWQ